MDDAIRVGVVSYGLDPAKNNIKRPETALESVISRLSAITSRVQSSVHRADSAANAILGYAGETTADGAGGATPPQAIATSAMDHLGEIENTLSKLEYHLGRMTQ